MIQATLSFILMHFLIKSLPGFHVFEIIFFRAGVTALFCMAYLRSQRVSIVGKNQKWLFLRAFCGIIAMSLFFVTLQRMPFGASVTLKYLSPLFAVIFAVIFLKEKVKPIQWLFVLSAFIGVLLLKGFDTRIDMLNLGLGVLGAFFAGMVYVLIRKIGKSEHPMVIVNYFMSSAAILSGIGMLFYWRTPTMNEFFCLLGIGFLGYFGQIWMTQSLQMEDASRMTPIKYSEVVYSLIIGWLWFGETYGWVAILGMGMVILSMIGNLKVKA